MGAPETWAETLARVFQQMDDAREFYTDVDGFVAFWPQGHAGGFYTAPVLRAIADELDRRNKPMDEALQLFFSEGNEQ